MPDIPKPWLKVYPENVPPQLVYPEIGLQAFVERSAQCYPQQTALVFLGKSITYAQLWQLINRFSAALYRLGVRKGDRVAIMLPNCPQSVIAYYAILTIGAVVVMVNPLYTERELKEQLSDADAKVLLFLDVLKQRVQNVRSKVSVEYYICTSIRDYLTGARKILYALTAKPVKTKRTDSSFDFFEFKDLMERDHPNPPRSVCHPKTDVAVLQYTGGTTGVPKGTMLTHYNLVVNTMQIMTWNTRCKPGAERVLGILPFFHVYGLTCALNYSALTGGTLILLPRFDVRSAIKAIDRYSPTFFPGAPTIYVAINAYPQISKYDLKSIQACISGAAPLNKEVQQTFMDLTDGATLVEGYGLTEASPVTHCNPLEKGNIVGSIGLPLPDTLAKVVDPSNPKRVLPPGEVGELLIKGPQIMKGYWRNPVETSRVLHDGWLHTGDLVRMDERGYFYIVDRLKEVILSGGYSVYPSEVEAVLLQHPYIREAAVVAKADAYRGEVVRAVIVVQAGVSVSAAEIIRYCKANLASFKVPREIEFCDELPRSAIGKVLKRALM